MSVFEAVGAQLKAEPKKWLITGVAGFIGSNLLEYLLRHDQSVVGLDDFSTGHQHNLHQVKQLVSDEQWQRFQFQQGSILDLEVCRRVVDGTDYVLHQAALGSVPRSIEEPLQAHNANLTGFLNILIAARDAEVRRFVYAASSSTYGDHPGLPKVEDQIGRPLSPYALTKYANELYAEVFALNYGFKCIGLRYFNVFGPRQDPDGAYAAVIPKWVAAMIKGDTVRINGDGETSRDFCFVDNAVQANVLAALAPEDKADEVYNVAVGERTTLNELFEAIRAGLQVQGHAYGKSPEYGPFRQGDVRHSQADISKARNGLGYEPEFDIKRGLSNAVPWYLANLTF